jgi:hypothetical protein
LFYFGSGELQHKALSFLGNRQTGEIEGSTVRHGTLKVVKPVSAYRGEEATKSQPFMLHVSDDDGDFLVVGARWVQDRWAGAAPVKPSTAEHLRTVEEIMLREADRRRHDGHFDSDHPMHLEHDAVG